jgi:hypothetical protein
VTRLRRLLSVLSPWRTSGYVVDNGEMRRKRVRALWVHRALDRLEWLLLVAGIGVLLFVAARADAQTWSTTIEWRNSVVRLVSACGPLSEAVARDELETGRARAVADLGRDDLPPLGTPEDPYVIAALADPRCPGNALACSATAPLSRSTWSLVRTTCGAQVLAALDHEVMHRWGFMLTRSIELGMFSDHPAGPGFRYDVIGRRVAIAPKPPKPPQPVEPEPTVVAKLPPKQARVLEKFGPAWTFPGAADIVLVKRLERKGLLEADGKGSYRLPRGGN